MNAIFSETMQDTKTKISQFIVEGTANSNMFSSCQKKKFGSCFNNN